MMGLGAFQGLVKYGAKYKDDQKVLNLFNYSLKRGVILAVLLSLIVYTLSPLIAKNLPGASQYLKIFSFQIIGLTAFEFVKNYFRLIHKNQLYALWEILYYLLLLVISIVFIHLFDSLGYVYALTITPFLISTIIIIKYRLLVFNKTGLDKAINPINFWKYGLIISLGLMSTQLLYVLDIIMIANIIKKSALVAVYKAAALFPLSLRFIPYVFIKTDYVRFAENEKNRAFLLGYYLNYLKIFLPLSIIINIVFWLSKDYLHYFFGEGYEAVSEIIWIFSFTLTIGYLFWVPLSNIIKVTNWVHLNTFVSAIALVFNIVLNFIFISKYGIVGAAWGSFITNALAGVMSLIIFLFYLKMKTE